MANPIGLSQTVMHHQVGRFELGGMENFNRNYPDFFNLVKDELSPLLGADAETNKRLIRAAMGRALVAQAVNTELQSQRHTLMRLFARRRPGAGPALRLRSVMHLYVEQPMIEAIAPLARYLGARALLWARGSGPSISFDEALSAPGGGLQEHFAGRFPRFPWAAPAPPSSCVARPMYPTNWPRRMRRRSSATFRERGVVGGTPPALPPRLCEATPLAGHRRPARPAPGAWWPSCGNRGDVVKAGEVLAHIVDPLSQRRTPSPPASTRDLRPPQPALGHHRHGSLPRGRLTPIRSGNLLSP